MKYVLGTGIAGLIWAFYNKNYVAIGDIHGGQMKSIFSFGPRYLHYTPDAEQFLKDLNLPIERIIIKTGYQLYKNKVHGVMIGSEFRERYYMKSRGLRTLDGFDKTVMSENKNSFEALKVDFNKIIEILCNKLKGRLKLGKVVSISPSKKIIKLESGEILPYEHLVTTIPLNVFAVLIERDNPETINFPKSEASQSRAVTYILLKPQDLKGFDYVYNANRTVPYHRLTADPKGCVAECFGILLPEEVKRKFRKDYIDSKILYNSQIIPYVGELNLEGIKFLGRYGSWKREYKAEQIITEAMLYGL